MNQNQTDAPPSPFGSPIVALALDAELRDPVEILELLQDGDQVAMCAIEWVKDGDGLAYELHSSEDADPAWLAAQLRRVADELDRGTDGA